MHSSYYKTFTIHFHGDYSGECKICEIRRDEKNQTIIPEEHKGKKLYDFDFPEIEIETKDFFKIAQELIDKKTINFSQDCDYSLKHNGVTITLNSQEIVDFYLTSLVRNEISYLDQLDFKQLLERYGDKKTSKDWYKQFPKGFIIMDPDGWDRTKYDFSFNQELITKKEFIKRLEYSTTILKNGTIQEFYNNWKIS